MLPTPAGWFPDPWNNAAVRFWDGRTWTSHTAWPGPAPTPPHPHLPTRAAWGAVIALLASVIASRYLLEAISVFEWPIAVYVSITAVIGYGPALMWCWYASKEWGTGHFRNDVGLSIRWADAGFGPLTWIGCVVAEIAVGAVVVALHIPFTSNVKDVSHLHADRSYVVSLLALAVIAAPIAEEIVFRGVVLRGLLSRHRVPVAVGLQAVLFGMAHFDPVRGMGNIGLIMVLSSVGAVLGAAAYLVRRLAPTMIAHAILNGVAMAIALSGWAPNR